MTQVTVDLDDLKALVFGTGAIKNIEGSLASFKSDPFTKTKVPLTEAHDRLASAMRNAERGQLDTVVKFDEPLTKDEQLALVAVSASVKVAVKAKKGDLDQVKMISVEEKAAAGEQMSVYDRLAAKGMIEMGQFIRGILWSGASAPAIVGDTKGFAARLTRRGYGALEQIQQKPNK